MKVEELQAQHVAAQKALAEAQLPTLTAILDHITDPEFTSVIQQAIENLADQDAKSTLGNLMVSLQATGQVLSFAISRNSEILANNR